MNIEKYINKVHNCDCLELLKELPDNCIDCVVTSPPYWNLRDYGLKAIIFGGKKDCEHIWGDSIDTTADIRYRGKHFAIGNHKKQEIWDLKTRISNLCNKCGAWKGQLGLEPTFEMFIDHLIEIFTECKRVLKKEGTMWVNLGDTFGGNNSRASNGGRAGYGNEREGVFNRGYDKCLCNIPSRFAIAMTDRLNLILRNEIIWHKPNCMPSSVTDRFTVDFEKIYFFTKSKRYYFKQQRVGNNYEKRILTGNGKSFGGNSLPTVQKANRKGRVIETIGRNMRTVWKISTKSFKEAHFATFPPELVKRCLDAGCPPKGIVYDPFMGACTVGLVALQNNLNFIGTELNPEYVKIAEERIKAEQAQLKLNI